MDYTQAGQQQTDSSEKHGQPTMPVRLPDGADDRSGADGDANDFDATDVELLHFVQTLVPLTDEGLDHWTWVERRAFLNWCLDEGVLTIQDGRLIPGEKTVPTAPLTLEPTEEGAQYCYHG